jgi:hypothetical protein
VVASQRTAIGSALLAVDHRERGGLVVGVLCHWLSPCLRSRDGAARLQAACSGPPALSPSACPKSQGWPGSMKPPTSSPLTHSAHLHAAPRAQRTVPVATSGLKRPPPAAVDGCRVLRSANALATASTEGATEPRVVAAGGELAPAGIAATVAIRPSSSAIGAGATALTAELSVAMDHPG